MLQRNCAHEITAFI